MCYDLHVSHQCSKPVLFSLTLAFSHSVKSSIIEYMEFPKLIHPAHVAGTLNKKHQI